MNTNAKMKLNILIAIMLVFSGICVAKTIKESHPNGKRKLKYSVNKQGQKHGSYCKYFENGKLHIKCRYRKDILHGSYIERNKKNKIIWKANYKNGKLHGIATRFDKKGRMIWQGEYIHGDLRFPRSAKFLATTLKQISKWSPSPEDKKLAKQQLVELIKNENVPKLFRNDETFTKDKIMGLRRVMQYRFICSVPYKHLRLHPQRNSHAQAAAYICKLINTIDHHPKNPGLPENVYDYCHIGTSQSNLTYGMGGVVTSLTSIDGYMDDSDPYNISKVGHRRWCLNPPMGYCGFGLTSKVMTSGKAKGMKAFFGAFYCFDLQGETFEKYTKDYDWDFIKFPAQGYHPAKGFFGKNHAWSISVNPTKYQTPKTKDIKVMVYKSAPAAIKKKQLKPVGEPLELGFFTVSNDSIGTGSCIIFRPEALELKRNAAYIVVVEGLKDKDENPVELIYPVMFI